MTQMENYFTGEKYEVHKTELKQAKKTAESWETAASILKSINFKELPKTLNSDKNINSGTRYDHIYSIRYLTANGDKEVVRYKENLPKDFEIVYNKLNELLHVK